MRAALKSALALVVIAALSLTGTVAVAAIDAWETPITISEAGKIAESPQLVSHGTTIIAVWRQKVIYDYTVQVSSSTDAGATWSTPVTLSDANQNAIGPQVVTDGTTITVIWRHSEGNYDANLIQVSSSADGGTTWSTPATLSDSEFNSGTPRLVTNGTTITAIWGHYPSGTRLQSASSSDGGVTWTDTVPIPSSGNQQTWGAQLVTDGTTITAIWHQDDERFDARVRVSSSSDNGATWSAMVNVSEEGEEATTPQIVTDGTTVTAIWSTWNGSTTDAVKSSSSTDGGATWSEPATLSMWGPYDPQLVTDGTTITAAWSRGAGDSRIEVSSSTDGGTTWSTPVTLSEAGLIAENPELVTDGATITATWSLSTSSVTSNIQVASSADGGATWGTPVNLSDPERRAGTPQLVTDGTTITTAWTRLDVGPGIQVLSLLSADINAIPPAFPDVPTTHRFYDEIMWLAMSGITGGYDDGTFRPGAAVTRQAMSAFLYRAAGSPAYIPPVESPFSDVSTSHPFYLEINWMASEGITTGYIDGTFRPSASVTRQAMSAFMQRYVDDPALTDMVLPASSPFGDVATGSQFFGDIAWMAAADISTGYDDGSFKPSAAVTRQAMAAFLKRLTDLMDGNLTISVSTWSQPSMVELAAQYMAENPNVTIELNEDEFSVAHVGLYWDLIDGHGAPTVALVDSGFMPYFLELHDDFVDLGDLGATAYQTDYLEWKWAQAYHPASDTLIGLGGTAGGMALCYRQDLLEGAGLAHERSAVAAATSTWPDFISFAEQYVANSGKPFLSSRTEHFLPLVQQNGAGYYDSNDQLSLAPVKPAFDQAVAVIDAGIVADISPWSAAWNIGFGTDAFAATLCPSWLPWYVENQLGESFAGQWDVTALPGPGGNYGGEFYTVPNQGLIAKQEAGYAFIEWLVAADQQLAIFDIDGALPSQPALYADASIQGQTNDFFNSAPVGKIFSDSAAELPGSIYYAPKHMFINWVMLGVLEDVHAGLIAPENAWAEAVARATTEDNQ